MKKINRCNQIAGWVYSNHVIDGMKERTRMQDEYVDGGTHEEGSMEPNHGLDR